MYDFANCTCFTNEVQKLPALEFDFQHLQNNVLTKMKYIEDNFNIRGDFKKTDIKTISHMIFHSFMQFLKYIYIYIYIYIHICIHIFHIYIYMYIYIYIWGTMLGLYYVYIYIYIYVCEYEIPCNVSRVKMITATPHINKYSNDEPKNKVS